MFPPPASPCIGLCQLDPLTGLCAGCARSGPEIGAWRDGDAAFRAAVWEEIPARAPRLGLRAWLLPWGSEEILGFLARSLKAGGACALGFGAAGVFRGPPDRVARDGDALLALTATAGLRLEADPFARAFGTPDGVVALGLPRARLGPAAAAAGPDARALRPQDRGAPLADLGSARPGGRISRRGATLVVETPLGRVETLLGRVETLAGAAWDETALPPLPGVYSCCALLLPAGGIPPAAGARRPGS